jgi:hypothetical protein
MNCSTRFHRVVHYVIPVAMTICAMSAWADEPRTVAEWNAEAVASLWPEMENTWVPIGWKDHPLRFNVLYNGTMIAQPVRYPARGQGVQLTFLPSSDGSPPAIGGAEPYQLKSRDGGVGDQGWADNPAPVLWTHLSRDGVVLRQDVFAHVTRGGPVRTGTEPLFAWIRLTREKPATGSAHVLIRVNQPHIQTEMDRHKNLIANPSASAYPGPLRLESAGDGTQRLLPDDAGRGRPDARSPPTPGRPL